MGTVVSGVTGPDGTFLGFTVTGAGPPVLLVHGASSDARQWARAVPLLATGHTVVSMDRRGRGASGPMGPDHSMETEYGDVITVAAVAAGIGAGPLHLVGHSSGARIALHAALQLPGLASLVLYEPPAPETFAPGVLDRLAAMADDGDREGILTTFLLDVAGNDPQALTVLRSRPIWPVMTDNALTLPLELRAASRYRFEPSALARLRVPTVLLVGEDSGPEMGQMARAIAGAVPDGQVRVLPGQGHGAMYGAPEEFVAELGRIFAAVSPTAAAGGP